MKNILETIVQILFIFCTFILVVLISLGITLEFEKIKTVTFWIETLGNFVLCMVTFNVVYTYDRRKRMHDKNSRFFKAYATNRMRVKFIEKNKLYTELTQAIELEMLERLKSKCNKKLNRLCCRITYEDAMSETPIDELMRINRVLPKRAKKLEKLILKIRAGEIYIKKIEDKVFLSDKELVNAKNDSFDFNDFKVELKRNLTKGLSFWITAIILAMIGFSFYTPNFLISLLKNITFLLNGMVCGISCAIHNIKLRTSIYENRNRFFQRRMGIELEYSEK